MVVLLGDEGREEQETTMRELKDEDAMPTGNEGEYVQIMLHILVDGFLEVTVDEHRFATPRPANHLLILFKDCRERKSWTLEIGTAKLELNSGCSYQFDVRQHGMCDVTQQPLARTVADTWPEEVHVQYRERLFTSLPLGLPPVGGREQGGWHPPDAEECWQYVGLITDGS